jgi:hypothetical protein
MSDNVVQFRKPGSTPPAEDPLYFVTLYPNSSLITDPNRDTVDRSHAAETIFDATFHILSDAENAHLLIAVTDARNITFRQKGSFETTTQHEWLARRLDDVYETCTGQRRSENRLAAFLHRFNPFRKGRQNDDRTQA